jgi:hypothetical protein
MIKAYVVSVLALGVIGLGAVEAQSPVIVQAADSVAASPSAPVPVAPTVASDSKKMLQSLEDMQALNSATIKKQEAALATLDELQKAVEELRIFSKRG